MNIVILIVVLIYMRGRQMKKLYLISIVVGYVIRLIIVTVFLFYLWFNPHYLPNYEKYPLQYFVLLGSDGGLYEKMIGYYTEHLTSNRDPFSGLNPLKKNGFLYSIGPDGINNELSIIYNPTNGTVSSGDIIIRKRFFP